jgi:hypothetical protein
LAGKATEVTFLKAFLWQEKNPDLHCLIKRALAGKKTMKILHFVIAFRFKIF